MVYAVQVNYHDHQSNMYGRIPGLRHRYAVEGSLDGQDWVTLVDRRNNYKDVPNDYVQVDNPARVRYVRYKNIEVPTLIWRSRTCVCSVSVRARNLRR